MIVRYCKHRGFLLFSGGIKRDQWNEIGLMLSFCNLVIVLIWHSFFNIYDIIMHLFVVFTLKNYTRMISLFTKVVRATTKYKNTTYINGVRCLSITQTLYDPATKRFNFIADAAEKAAPAVVYIEILGSQPTLFGQAKEQPLGAGSGFLVTDYGVVLTNAHVVNQATSLKVQLQSKEVYLVCRHDLYKNSEKSICSGILSCPSFLCFTDSFL